MASSITARLLCLLLGASLICVSLGNPLNHGDQVAALWYDGETMPAWLDELRPSKRSPSIGLSLAEYMAQPSGSDSFHFLSGKK